MPLETAGGPEYFPDSSGISGIRGAIRWINSFFSQRAESFFYWPSVAGYCGMASRAVDDQLKVLRETLQLEIHAIRDLMEETERRQKQRDADR